MNGSSGEVRTGVRLDREETSRYHLTVLARDMSPTEPREGTANLTITVLDDNDNAPDFAADHYSITVPDRTQSGK